MISFGLIPALMTCVVYIELHVPSIDLVLTHKAHAECKLIDGDFMKVGTPGDKYTPIMVDCSQDKTVRMLDPDRTNRELKIWEEDCDY